MKYVVEKQDGSTSKPLGRARVMFHARKELVTGEGPFTGKLDGLTVFESKDRLRSLQRTGVVLGRMKVGETLRVRNDSGLIVFWVRAVEEDVPLIDINGNDHADQFWSWVVATYPEFHPRFAGSYVCKDVAGTSTPSQHSYGNAVDVFFDTAEHQREVFRDIVAGKCPVPICHAISEDDIWDGDGNPTHYSGEFHHHLHGDFCPQYSGGCGVRG